MKVKVLDLNNNEVGSLEIDESIFALEVRPDIIKSVIDWQLAKRQAGTHQTKTISEVSGTTKKPHAQKGTGRARQGSLRQVHMRGGGISHGPVSRSHETYINKKVRKLGLMHAMSSKTEVNKLFVVKDLILENAKTSNLLSKLENFGFKTMLFIDSDSVNENFALASRNLHNINLLPQIGANVYDIVKHDCLVLTEAAVASITGRLK
jgi:large subunit ribosomal protein L4